MMNTSVSRTAKFRTALQKADCKPHNAVMVGDRLDNDIVPANKVVFQDDFESPTTDLQ